MCSTANKQGDERISEFAYRIIEIIEFEEQNEKRK